MKSLILGSGEVGNSLYNLLSNYYGKDIFLRDVGDNLEMDFEVIHICFPYSEKFIEQVKRYQQHYKPKYTIIHSTVPVGTSISCEAIHSPIVGIHPHLEESLQTFTKFIGGDSSGEILDYFKKCGIKVYPFERSETTELMKILSTTYYGLMIEYTKEVKRLCDNQDLPFEAWTLWNQNYNKGYSELGYPEYVRPNLVPFPGKIGGHCILPNLELLDSNFTKFLRDLNK